MKNSSNDLVADFADLVLNTQGEHKHFDHVSSPESANERSLVFLQYAKDAPASAAVIVTDSKGLTELEGHTAFKVVVADVRLAQAKIKQRYYDYKAGDLEWPDIHVSAVVHESVSLGKGCRVGPNAVIGADCALADNVIVRAGAVVEHGVVIGVDSIINANVNVGYDTQIGARVTIQAGAVIGSEGYGFAPDSSNHYHRIPHTGRVVLEDDVHIGANTCIDRGTYGETLISCGVKIDNLVHIAHNVSVGEDTLLTAQTSIAGSSKVGKRVIASGQTGILDHKIVADGAILVQRCGVSEDIPSAGMWAGTPAKPFKEYVRTLGVTKKVVKLEQQLKLISAQLDALNKDDNDG
jgi:UDP-3-O-[3-hydroxymyristoyl] glucosamine N-acyltransferase